MGQLDYICSLTESQSGYFAKLKKLVEDTYSANGNKKITLMSHSLGCPYSLVFLNKQTKDWKDKYILQWITLSGKKRSFYLFFENLRWL